MKFNKIATVMAATLLAVGAVNTALAGNQPENSVQKKITLTAQINDGIFVSKPDGSTWYSTEELDADDYKQTHFSKVLPIRVWTKNPDFNITLDQPLKMSSGYYEMQNPTVVLTTSQGDVNLVAGNPEKVTQNTATADGYDSIYNLKIDVDAPPTAEEGKPSTNGSYSGDLTMYFEPSAGSSAP